MAKSKTPMTPVKKKQLMLLGGLGGVVIAIAVGAAFLGSPPQRSAAAKPEVPIKKQFGSQEGIVNEKEVWRTQEGARVSQLQDELQDLKDKLKQSDDKKVADDKRNTAQDTERLQMEARRAIEQQLSTLPKTSANDAERRQLEARLAVEQQLGGQPRNSQGVPPSLPAPQPTGPNNLPTQNPQVPGMFPYQPGAQARSVPQAGMPGPGANAYPPGQPGFPQGIDVPGVEPVRGIMKVDLSDEKVTPPVAGKKGGGGDSRGSQGGTNQRNTTENYLPAGSFLRATNLGGLDAPTGGQSQQNPHPIVFRVVDFANLPNKFRADYKECFVTGNGYGDLSAERAYIRLDRLSCIAEDGAAIDVGIKGFVAGEDGKAGMRGRLVSKQGSVLANALVAGVASGIGQAFVQSNTTTSTSALGTTQTVDSGKAYQAGLAQGVGKALDKLSNYYIQLSEKMFPIIEVDSGREVDLVVTRGISIER